MSDQKTRQVVIEFKIEMLREVNDDDFYRDPANIDFLLNESSHCLSTEVEMLYAESRLSMHMNRTCGICGRASAKFVRDATEDDLANGLSGEFVPGPVVRDQVVQRVADVLHRAGVADADHVVQQLERRVVTDLEATQFLEAIRDAEGEAGIGYLELRIQDAGSLRQRVLSRPQALRIDPARVTVRPMRRRST